MKSSALLCIRSLDVIQASPFLEMAWKKIKITNRDSFLLLKDQPKNFKPLISDALYEDIDNNVFSQKRIKKVISWSIPNERTIEDITLLKDVETVPGPVTAIYKLADKRATKTLFEQFSLPTPKWEILDREFTQGHLLKEPFGNKLEIELISHIPFPVISKPLWDCMGHGIEIISNEFELIKNLNSNDQKNILVESFIDGYLGCIEIIGTPDNYFIQPPCFTGKTSNGVRSNFDTVRISHPEFFKGQLNHEIKMRLCNLLTYLDYSGACCVDFIVKDDNIFFLEINPRISGISCLSSAASGINSFEALYLISSGEWNKNLVASNISNNSALQIGGRLADEIAPELFDKKDLIIYRDEVIHVDGNPSRNIIVAGNHNMIKNIFKSLDSVAIESFNLEQSIIETSPINCETVLKN